MSRIQIDMFEVQLGAAMLLQFRDSDGKPVRVLADAGVHGGGYPVTHVHSKLSEALASFDSSGKRLDLIVGTHYDADHLLGLVPIIEDGAIEIGEAWLPPVANDEEFRPADERVGDSDFLAFQLATEKAAAVLRKYLQAKRERCEELRKLEHAANEVRFGDEYRKRINELWPDDSEDKVAFLADEDWENLLESAMAYFQRHLEDTAESTGETEHHHANSHIAHISDLPGIRADQPSPWWFMGSDPETAQRYWWEGDLARAELDSRNLAYVRKSEAEKAINAASLAKVVKALREREIPIVCYGIPDGRPRRFAWSKSDRKFVGGKRRKSDGPEISLLGPSESLIAKHGQKLPIGDYGVTLFTLRVPVKGITPSNQLSYVMRFQAEKQGILVSGDAGCVDFSTNPRGDYYPDLLKALCPLHVVQVAHHGGNNAHFYNVLLEAKYAEQTDRSFLLLSHATDDKTRPSPEFALFLEEALKPGDDIQLLFTSKPKPEKVRDYREIIHGVVGTPGPIGDVRIQFNGEHWTVLKHAIAV